MKRIIITALYIILFITLFYVIKGNVDPVAWNRFWHFMAGDYPDLWRNHIAPIIPPVTHPISLVVLAIVALGFIRRLLTKNDDGG